MNQNLDPNSESQLPIDKEIERALRPVDFGEFAGQESVVENLKIFVKAARQRG